MRRFLNKIPPIALFLFLAAALPAYARFEETFVGVKMDEVWQASQQALEPYGIRKKDDAKRMIETKWTEDTVVRRRGFLKKITAGRYRRRYRFQLQLKEKGPVLQIQIQGNFQEKSADSRGIDAWRKFKPESQDYELEKEIFKKILMSMEENRKK